MSTSAPSSINQESLLAKVSLRLIPFLLILYVISYLDRINLSFAAHQMKAELSLSDAAYGFGGGIFFFGYCVFGIPSNFVIQKLGPRNWISLIMVCWGLVTLSMCLVHDQNTFYILRLVLGVAEAGFFPGMLLYLTYWFPPAKYGMAVARFMTAVPLAAVLGSLISAPALALTGVAGIAGWKWLFIVTGLPAVLFGIATFFVLADRPSQAKWLTKEEGLAVEAMTAKTGVDSTTGDGTSDDGATAEKGDNQGSFSAAIRNPLVWRFSLLYFSMSVCMYGFQLWLPQIVQNFGHTTDTETALLSAIPAVFQGLGMQIVAGNSDKSGERRFHLAVSSIITCIGLVSTCLLGDAWLKLAGLCLAAFGIWGTLGPFWALARGNLSKAAQPAAIAFINSVGGLGGFVGPYAVGLAKQWAKSLPGADSDFAAALAVLAGTAVLTALLAVTSQAKTLPAGESAHH